LFIIGPFTYVPRVEEEIVEEVKSIIVEQNTAIQLQALKKTVDYLGTSREAGENWLVRKTGAYLPRVNEKFVGYIKGLIITENNVLLLEAVSCFTDVYGIKRRAGERWIITPEMVDFIIILFMI
jgi:major vault protein